MDNIKLYFDLRKSFTHKIDNDIPKIFNSLNLGKGTYVWGIASNGDLDKTGERVVLDPDIAMGLEKGGKLMLEHDKSGANSGGLASFGTIQFSRVVPEMDNQHILLAKLNDAHQNFDAVLGSIENGNLDSFSVAGNASMEQEFNSESGKNETIRRVHSLNETSLTSSPANGAAGIAGLFRKNLGFGGVEITKPEGKMENTNFVPLSDFETLKSGVGELTKKMDSFMETVTKSNAQAIDEIKKAMTDDDLKKDDEATEEAPAEETPAETPAEPEAEKTDAEPDLKKQVSELTGQVAELKKSLPTGQGVAKDGRADTNFQKNGINTVEENPLAKMAGIRGCV